MSIPVWPAGLTTLLILGLTGCVHHRVIPAQVFIDAGALPAIYMSGAVDLIDRSLSVSEPVEFCSGDIYSYYAHQDDLTQGALAALADIFIRNHVSIAEGADKQLVFTLVEAACEKGFWTIDMVVRIRIQTGQGYQNDFVGNESIGHIAGTTWAVEKAISNAVLAMFEDREIVRYLQQDYH